MLEIVDLKKEIRKNSSLLLRKKQVFFQLRKKFEEELKNQMEKTQREYYLNEQLKAIQKELGEIDEGKDELSSIIKIYC